MEIRSLTNPRVKQWAQLLHKKGREKQGRWLIEGIHLIEEAMRSSVVIESIVHNGDAKWKKQVEEWQKQGIETIQVSEPVIRKCTDTMTPQGIFAILLPFSWRPEDVQARKRHIGSEQELVVVIERIQDPGNLGTIIRSADALGATSVWVSSDSADLYHPKTVRATMGSIFHVPVSVKDMTDAIAEIKASGARCVGATLSATKPCHAFDWTQDTFLFIGNEANGLSEEVLAQLTDEVTIPMVGKAESLNAAMATNILLYEAMRQRTLKT